MENKKDLDNFESDRLKRINYIKEQLNDNIKKFNLDEYLDYDWLNNISDFNPDEMPFDDEKDSSGIPCINPKRPIILKLADKEYCTMISEKLKILKQKMKEDDYKKIEKTLQNNHKTPLSILAEIKVLACFYKNHKNLEYEPTNNPINNDKTCDLVININREKYFIEITSQLSSNKPNKISDVAKFTPIIKNDSFIRKKLPQFPDNTKNILIVLVDDSTESFFDYPLTINKLKDIDIFKKLSLIVFNKFMGDTLNIEKINDTIKDSEIKELFPDSKILYK